MCCCCTTVIRESNEELTVDQVQSANPISTVVVRVPVVFIQCTFPC